MLHLNCRNQSSDQFLKLVYLELGGALEFVKKAQKKVDDSNQEAQTDGLFDAFDEMQAKLEGLEKISSEIREDRDALSKYKNLSEAMALALIDRHPYTIYNYGDSFEKSAHRAMAKKYIEEDNVNQLGQGLKDFTGLDQEDFLMIIDAAGDSPGGDWFVMGQVLDIAVDRKFSNAQLQVLFNRCAEIGLSTPLLYRSIENKFENLNWKLILQKVFDKSGKNPFGIMKGNVEGCLGKEGAKAFYEKNGMEY